MCTRFANKTNIKAQLRAVRNIWEFVVFCQANITSFKLESFDPVKISLAASNSSPNIKVRKALGKPFRAKNAFFSILKKGGGVQPMFKNRPKINLRVELSIFQGIFDIVFTVIRLILFIFYRIRRIRIFF